MVPLFCEFPSRIDVKKVIRTNLSGNTPPDPDGYYTTLQCMLYMYHVQIDCILISNHPRHSSTRFKNKHVHPFLDNYSLSILTLACLDFFLLVSLFWILYRPDKPYLRFTGHLNIKYGFIIHWSHVTIDEKNTKKLLFGAL